MAGEILCVERAWCERVLSGGAPLPDGLIRPATPHEVLTKLLNNGHALWLPRAGVEDDPAFKQIIPYVMVRAPGGGKVLAYRRSKEGSEGRLHGALSVGFGGHVEAADLEGSKIQTATFAVRRACYRELREELAWPREMPFLSLAGLVNFEGDSVGKVHIGVVMEAVSFNRIDEFSPSHEVADLAFREYTSCVPIEYEPWSRLILESGATW